MHQGNPGLSPGQAAKLTERMADVSRLLIRLNSHVGEANNTGHRLTEAVVLLAAAINEVTREETT
jgi:hypothetical protein